MNDITLLPLLEVHLEMVRNWRNMPEVAKYMYTEEHITKEQQEQWFEKIKDEPSQKYWIIAFEGTLVGLVSLYNIKPKFKSCYWAFYLGNSSIRGAGIGSKVEYNMLKKVFEEMQFNKLLCEVFTTNDAVTKMHEKFGFRREGYFREHILKNDAYHDVVSLAYLRKEWDQVKDSLYKKVYESH
jgi:UDP-4-amino-4,6-dideoxy-N-acetyl-beta-L-altrosamine N-acetyltransferase